MERLKVVNESRINELIGLRDLTDAKNGVNPINLVMGKMRDSLQAAGLENIQVVRGQPMVSVVDNFDTLLFPQDAIMRTGLHTLYVDDHRVLRTQVSATACQFLRNEYDGRGGVILFPGLVYRREGTHHQLDIWKIRKEGKPVGTEEVLELLDLTVRKVLPLNTELKIGGKELYYIVNGIGAKVNYGGRWQTVFTGGRVVDQVLTNLAIDPRECSVVAVGISLERLAMMIKGIDDPRLFRSNDPRVVNQMRNLESFRPVSFYPPIRRDLSVPVATEITQEEIKMVVKTTTEDGLIESISIVSETSYDDLPTKARERLGIRPGEKNVLVSVVLRSFNRTLKREEADKVRDNLFGHLNHCDSQAIAKLTDLPRLRGQ